MPYKDFNIGDVFTADDADLLMRQGLIVVANKTQRDAITAPSNGLKVWRTDTGGIDLFARGGWITSTVWTALALASGVTQTSTPAPAYRVNDGFLSLRGLPTISAGIAPNTVLATLPVDARPLVPTRTVTAGATGIAVRLDVNTGGTIVGNSGGTATVGTWLSLDLITIPLY